MRALHLEHGKGALVMFEHVTILSGETIAVETANEPNTVHAHIDGQVLLVLTASDAYALAVLLRRAADASSCAECRARVGGCSRHEAR